MRCLPVYAHNILVGTPLRRLGRRVVRSIEDCEIVVAMAGSVLPKGALDSEELSTEKIDAALRTYMRRCRRRARRPKPIGEPVRSNLELLGGALGFDATDRAVLGLLLAKICCSDLNELLDALGAAPPAEFARWLAAALDTDPEAVRRALNPSGRLCASGVVQIDRRSSHLNNDDFEIVGPVVELLLAPNLREEDIIARFLPEAPPATLEWDDYAHMDGPATLARQLLLASLEKGSAGTNLLFYGPTGTGKTEFARLVARELGVRLHVVGAADDDGDPASPRERLASLSLGLRLIRDGRVILLFDEIEDLFERDSFFLDSGHGRMTASMSKKWFNDVLETNPAPVIWISNSVHGIDLAFLRRFRLAVEFRPPGVGQRARILARHLGTESRVDEAEVSEIAQRYQASPGLIETAVSSARLVAPDGRPDRATLERFLAPSEKLMTGTDPSRRPVFDPKTYRLDAVECNTDLTDLAAQLTRPGASLRGLSMCLYGPPGTGKSEFVRYLAWRMGRPLVLRRGSDILSMWVGGTERNIADAFAEAEAEDAVLLFDEVDSFLRSRGLAQRGWEVSQVNELLQQLETYQGIVACTTNLWRDVDEAALRRFVLKLEFGFLTTDRAVPLFETVFGPWLGRGLTKKSARAVRGGLAAMHSLTPGDFAAVARRVRALGQVPSPLELVDELRREIDVKREAPRSVGFHHVATT